MLVHRATTLAFPSPKSPRCPLGTGPLSVCPSSPQRQKREPCALPGTDESIAAQNHPLPSTNTWQLRDFPLGQSQGFGAG